MTNALKNFIIRRKKGEIKVSKKETEIIRKLADQIIAYEDCIKKNADKMSKYEEEIKYNENRQDNLKKSILYNRKRKEEYDNKYEKTKLIRNILNIISIVPAALISILIVLLGSLISMGALTLLFSIEYSIGYISISSPIAIVTLISHKLLRDFIKKHTTGKIDIRIKNIEKSIDAFEEEIGNLHREIAKTISKKDKLINNNKLTEEKINLIKEAIEQIESFMGTQDENEVICEKQPGDNNTNNQCLNLKN